MRAWSLVRSEAFLGAGSNVASKTARQAASGRLPNHWWSWEMCPAL